MVEDDVEVVVEEEQSPKKKKKAAKKKHYWWRFLLCFFGGFLFAFVSIGGAVLVGGTVLKTSDLVSLFGGNPDEVLTEDYQNTTLLNLVMDLSQKKFDTLEDINKITPLVRQTLEEQINPTLEQYLKFTLDWDAIANASFTDKENGISTAIQDQFYDGIKIIDFVSDSSTLLNIYKYFLYDVVRDDNGDPIKDANGNVTIDEESPITLRQYAEGAKFLNSIMDYIRIGDVIEGAETSTDPIIIALKDTTIGNLKQRMNTLTIGELFTETQKQSNPLLNDNNLGQYTLSDLSNTNTIDSIHINAILGDDTSTFSSLLKAIYNQDLTIGNLKTDDLTTLIKVGDVIDPSSSKIVYALKDKTIASLGNQETIMGLLLSDIFDIPNDPDNLLYQYKDCTLEFLTTLGANGEFDLNSIILWDYVSHEGNPLLEALYNKDHNMTVADLSDYDTIATIPLASFLGDISDNTILEALAEKGATLKNLNEVIASLTVADIIEVSAEDQTNHTIKAMIIDALGSYPITEIADHFNDLELGQIIYVNDSSPLVLRSLETTKLSELSTALGGLKVGQVIEIAPGSAFDKYAIKNATLSNATDFQSVLTANLTLGDIIDIDHDTSPKILLTLENVVLDNIEDKVKTLKLGDMIPLIEGVSHPILWAMRNAVVFGDSENDLSSVLENLKMNEVFKQSECTGFMKLLWDDTDGGNFPISQISSKASDIFTTKTLYNLYDAGLLSEIGQRSSLDKTISGTIVGNMTISAFISAALTYLP